MSSFFLRENMPPLSISAENTEGGIFLDKYLFKFDIKHLILLVQKCTFIVLKVIINKISFFNLQYIDFQFFIN